ncbi:hypothetical protein D3C78_1684530 [compost metagenome]
MGQAHARHHLEHVLHGLHVLVAQQALRHDVDGLGDVAQRRFDLGRAGGGGRVVGGFQFARALDLDFTQCGFRCLLGEGPARKSQRQCRDQRTVCHCHESLER